MSVSSTDEKWILVISMNGVASQFGYRLGKWCENLLVSQSTHPFSVDYFSIWDDGGDQSRAFALEFKVKPSPEIIQAIWERAKSFPDPYLKMTRWQLFSERVVHTLTPLEDSRNE